MFKIKVNCPTCNGTGIYKDVCAKGKSAFLCMDCKGKGYKKVALKDKFANKYIMFTGIKKVEGINRVFQNRFAFHHNDINTNGIKFEEGGVTYEKWLKGEKPKPVKDLYCPLFWINEFENNEELIKEFKKKLCDINLEVCDSITNCKFNCNKNICWEYYEILKSIYKTKDT